MDNSDNGVEPHAHDDSPQPFAHHLAQHEQDRVPHPTAASEAPDQPPDARRQRTSAIMSTGQAVPSLPDEPTIRAPPAAPILKPYYSLISDTTKSATSPETFYPRVRYIFNDDDPDLLTEAFSAQHGAAHLAVSKPYMSGRTQTGPVSLNQRLTAPDRALLLDLDLTPDGQGYTVASATNLTKDWAVTSAKMQCLQTGPSDDVPGAGGDQTMVLLIQGSGLPTSPLEQAGVPTTTKATIRLDGAATPLLRDEKETSAVGDYTTLVHSFERRMAFLQNVARNAEER